MLMSTATFAATLLVVTLALALPSLYRRSLPGAATGVALSLLLLLVGASPARAVELRHDEAGTVKIVANETIDETVMLSGETIVMAGHVDGDVFAAGKRIEITGTLSGNLYCIGENVKIEGAVGGNVHAAGQEVDLRSEIGGAGYLVGEGVTLAEGASLGGDGFVAGESVQIKGRVGRTLHIGAKRGGVDGTVGRSVRGYVEHLAVGSSATVGGDIDIATPNEDFIEVDPNAAIAGELKIEIKQFEEAEQNDFLRGGFYLGILLRTIALLLFGALLVSLFPSLLPTPPRSAPQLLVGIGIGFVVFVATPVAMLVAAVTVVGIPIAILLAMLYTVLLYAAKLTVAYAAASNLVGDDSGSRRRLFAVTAATLLAIIVIAELPWVGPGLHFLVLLLGLGTLAEHMRRRLAGRAVGS